MTLVSMHYRLISRISLLLVILFCGLPLSAQVIVNLTDYKNDGFLDQSVSDDGSVVVAVSKADPLGTNPNHLAQLFKWEFPGGAVTQLTSFKFDLTSASVRDDGQIVAFSTTADPLGQNTNESSELFLIGAHGSGLVQLTDDTTLGGGRSDGARISGTGNRVLFRGSIDPLGNNPDQLDQLFVIDTVTQVVTQLTQITLYPEPTILGIAPEIDSFSISDSGETIVFSCNGDLTGDNADEDYQIFKVDPDSLNLTQLTAVTDNPQSVQISGNGSRVAFAGSAGGIYWMTSMGTALTPLGAGDSPSITDDGAWIYFSNADSGQPSDIYKISERGGSPVQLTSGFDVSDDNPVVSGSDARVIFTASGEAYPGGNNPDLGDELTVMDNAGGNIQQLTENKESRSAFEPDISSDGSRVIHTVNFHTQRRYQISLQEIDGVANTMFVSLETAEVYHPTITADGETVAFYSYHDLTGEGGDPAYVFRIQADGTGLARLTYPANNFGIEFPVVAANGSVVVYQSSSDLLAVPLSGGTPTVVADEIQANFKTPMVSADGLWATWMGPRPMRGRIDGSFSETLVAGFSQTHDPDISGDGQRVVFEWYPDIYLYDASTGINQQMTDNIAAREPKLSEDGEWIYFLSSSPIFGEEPGNFYRIHVATGSLERAGGRRTGQLSPNNRHLHPSISVDADGGRAVFTGGEAYLVDYERLATIRPSVATPTLVEWDEDPRAVRHDVIRGDGANLQSGPGNTVDLGPVSCLEDDSSDTNTLGDEDSGAPLSGQLFFFLLRGTQGILDGPGSYSQGTGAAERVASSGDCPS